MTEEFEAAYCGQVYSGPMYFPIPNEKPKENVNERII